MNNHYLLNLCIKLTYFVNMKQVRKKTSVKRKESAKPGNDPHSKVGKKSGKGPEGDEKNPASEKDDKRLINPNLP